MQIPTPQVKRGSLSKKYETGRQVCRDLHLLQDTHIALELSDHKSFHHSRSKRHLYPIVAPKTPGKNARLLCLPNKAFSLH